MPQLFDGYSTVTRMVFDDYLMVICMQKRDHAAYMCPKCIKCMKIGAMAKCIVHVQLV